MNPCFTVLIVPALTAVGGQCRIVAKHGDIPDALRNYRESTDRSWREIGVMNSRGKLVSLIETAPGLRQELEDYAPLYAGLVCSTNDQLWSIP